MAIERIDNWELVLAGSELDANNRYKIEDSHIRCALIREIGTDQASTELVPPVDFGLRDHPYMDIDTFIAPYYKSSNNLNVMRFSGKKGLKWVFTGFELPLPLDLELEINGLEDANRVYMKGTLYKNVMSADDPINQYLMARLIEHNYKQLRPLYWRDITIPEDFKNKNDEYVLDDVTDTLVEWKAADPKYTIAPSQNINYVIKNTIQVMWGSETLKPKDVEFRLKHNRIDVGVIPRLDHMFLPPADGITRYMEESLLMKSISDCQSAWTPDGDCSDTPDTDRAKEGTPTKYARKIMVTAGGGVADDTILAYKDLASTIDISGFTMIGFWIGALAHALDAGEISLVLDDTPACASPIEELPLPPIPIATIPGEMTYVMLRMKAPKELTALKSVGIKNTSGAPIIQNDGFYIDDVRPLPLKVTHNPMEVLVKGLSATDFTGGAGGEVVSVNYASGEIAIEYDAIPTSLLTGYYAFRVGGGRDVFSLREISAEYHKVTYPHKQSYVFVNKSGDDPEADPNETLMDLYTLAEYYQTIPAGQEISPSVLAAARALLV